MNIHGKSSLVKRMWLPKRLIALHDCSHDVWALYDSLVGLTGPRARVISRNCLKAGVQVQSNMLLPLFCLSRRKKQLEMHETESCS